MNQILRQKRKELGLTQEQVANYLGVTAPAVNKWEKGSTFPDITLLPVLAKLLKTDPNTLLEYQTTLSQQEILHHLQELATTVKQDGLEQGFTLALERVREYPGCAELVYRTALALDGTLLTTPWTAQQKKPYEDIVISLYEQSAKSDDPALAQQATYLLVSKWIAQQQYETAQELLDTLLPHTVLDPRGLQADIWRGQGEFAKAANLLETKLMQSVQDHQATLCRLIQLAVHEGNETLAVALSNCARQECRAFEMGEYWENIAMLEVAAARQDVSGGLKALATMLDAAVKPWSGSMSPLFAHIPHQEAATLLNGQLLAALLASLEEDPKFAFLHAAPEFCALLDRYRAVADSLTADDAQH